MAVISLCFSGHPRAILSHADAWSRYIGFLREKYEVKTFMHCWSEQGLVRAKESGFSEGNYVEGRFQQFDALLDLLRPAAFRIESRAELLDRTSAAFPRVFLTGTQAPKHAILSQLYSMEQADRLRVLHDAEQGPSGAILKARLDLVPQACCYNEIDFILANPAIPVVFAPPPDYHPHIGGGGGCTVCHTYFHEHFTDPPRLRAGLRSFLQSHGRHSNDICDLYAFSNPKVMERYASLFSKSEALWRRIEDVSDICPAGEYEFVADTSRGPKDGTLSHASNMEEDPYFYPEKLIRYNMTDCLVIHAETRFLIARR